MLILCTLTTNKTNLYIDRRLSLGQLSEVFIE